MSEGMRNSLAQTACVHCREHKVRCSRQLPQCARCAKLDVACAFPEPPNRHAIAVRRETRKRQAGRNLHNGDKHRSDKSAVATKPNQGEQDPALGHDDARSVFALDPDTHQLLQDTYFSCMYNATLTFHRPTFDREYAFGDIAEHVLQAVYAMAICLLPKSSRGHKNNPKLENLGDLKSLSKSWASEAGKTALQRIDQPTIPAIQTCLILALFWFSRGDSRRNTMFSGIAYRATYCLLQEHEAETAIDQEASNPLWLEFEQLRRLFWSSWSMHCINSDQYPVGSSTRPQLMGMPLPMSEAAYVDSRWEDCGTLGGNSTSPVVFETHSLMANVMKLVLLWSRVRNHIDAMRDEPYATPWNNAFTLYDEIKNWQSQLHPSLSYSKANLYQMLVLQQQPVCLLLYALHHQCGLALHASLLPYLSGSPSQNRVPSEAARVSAEIALGHARALSELADDLVALECEPNRIAPYVGYSMYVAANVHLTVMARDAAMAESARVHLITCARLLRNMKPYWVMLEKLWQRLQRLYQLQVSDVSKLPQPSSGESTLRDLESQSNVDGVVGDSVQHFSLRRLQKTSSRAGADGTESGMSILDAVIDQSSWEEMVQRFEENETSEMSSCVNQGPDLAAISPPRVGLLGQEALTNGTTVAEGDSAAADALDSHSFDDFENWWEWDIGIDSLLFDYYLGAESL